VDVEVIAGGPEDLEADLIAVGLAEGDQLPEWLRDLPGADDVKASFRKTVLLRPVDSAPVLVVGLGKAEERDPERVRVAAALAQKVAASREATSLAWIAPTAEATTVTSLIEGTLLSGYRFDRFRSRDPDDPPSSHLERLILAVEAESGLAVLEEAARAARIASEAENRTRDLQNLPGNLLGPGELAERAREIADAHDSVSAEILGAEEIASRGMGGLTAVSAGSAREPRLITLRYEGDRRRERIGLVGKAVTFDSGGISIKPAARMQEMKMDMSGGAAVLEAVAAIAELKLPLNLIAVVPATENLLSGSATRPGDVITQLNGKTVEVNNTDAEGRLILADALAHCVAEGADRLLDIATLTGGIVIALGSTYAGLVSNDDEWAGEVQDAGTSTGEIAWRLPLHPEYTELAKGTVADLTNSSEKRKATPLYAAAFLQEFVEGRPWGHLDIAGVGWDTGREYWGRGATGWGTRLLVELARNLAAG